MRVDVDVEVNVDVGVARREFPARSDHEDDEHALWILTFSPAILMESLSPRSISSWIRSSAQVSQCSVPVSNFMNPMRVVRVDPRNVLAR